MWIITVNNENLEFFFNDHELAIEVAQGCADGIAEDRSRTNAPPAEVICEEHTNTFTVTGGGQSDVTIRVVELKPFIL